MNPLLHRQHIVRIPLFGRGMERQLARRVAETRALATGTDPDVSIVIRSKDNAAQLKGLLQDIRKQDFNGAVEIIVVDTESCDGSVNIARQFGAKVLSIKQAEFSYPKALNLGFAATTKPWIFSFVDHSALSNRYVLKAATRWGADLKLAAVWAFALPNANATVWEQFGYVLWVGRKLAEPAHDVRQKEKGIGLLAGNDLLIRRSAWETAGGFDERYGAGGEDSALGRVLLDLGYRVAYDPVISVYHAHGLGLLGCVRQGLYWRTLVRPLAFDLTALRRYRSDL